MFQNIRDFVNNNAGPSGLSDVPRIPASRMAHDAVLEALICGIGYEMTPSEEELRQRNKTRDSMSGTLPPPSKASFQAKTHHSSSRDSEEHDVDDDGVAPRRLRGSNKLRRAFSLNSYRNPFRSNSSANATLQPQSSGVQQSVDIDCGPTEAAEAKRSRVSWRKFLLKIAAQFGGSNLIVSEEGVMGRGA